MVAPASGQEFFDLVLKSGLVDRPRLDSYRARIGDNGFSEDVKTAARQFIHAGLLTNFQVGQLLQGKWRGYTFGKYRVLERLGTSANSNVYLCEHLVMHRRVAVKVLPTVKAEDPGALARFHREARAAAALDHANIVHAYDSDQDGDLHFIVMEYVDGFSLQEIVQKHGALSVRRAAHYMKQAAVALQYIHDSGLLHRDIKPGNLLLDRSGVIRVLDLGLARFYQDHLDELTQKYDANNILGTADYLSPEQARDSHDVDTRTDIYSLGATFYFLLTARPPFDGKTVTQKLMAHQLKEPTPLRELRSSIPDGLAAVVSRMMAKDPAKRHQTPDEIIQSLSAWTAEPVAAPSEEEMPKLCVAAQLAGTPETQSRRDCDVAKIRALGPIDRMAGVAVPTARSGAGSNHRGPSSSDVCVLPRQVSTLEADVPAQAAETDNALPRTDTQRDLPRTGRSPARRKRRVLVRRRHFWIVISAAVFVASVLGTAVAIIALR